MKTTETISIAVPVWDEHGNVTGETRYEREALHVIGDWAVTRAVESDRLYAVTHRPSGRRLPLVRERLEEARHCADACAVVFAGVDPEDVRTTKRARDLLSAVRRVAERARKDAEGQRVSAAVGG